MQQQVRQKPARNKLAIKATKVQGQPEGKQKVQQTGASRQTGDRASNGTNVSYWQVSNYGGQGSQTNGQLQRKGGQLILTCEARFLEQRVWCEGFNGRVTAIESAMNRRQK
jgi:hypothetical protein